MPSRSRLKALLRPLKIKGKSLASKLFSKILALTFYKFMHFLARRGWIASRAFSFSRYDDRVFKDAPKRIFSHSSRPLIRWVKGPGKDDEITKAAIAQATRLFGDKVDYCICTNGMDAERMRKILQYATQPVEWWPVDPSDNPKLASKLSQAGCPPKNYGYWWKWFPERVRENAPEWILDGDMVITGIPDWFNEWVNGRDVCRVTQDDRGPVEHLYGEYVRLVDEKLRLYSGLISLPSKKIYMKEIETLLNAFPLKYGHDGRRDMCEQGVIAAVFQQMNVTPIPLYEFPFARSFEDHIDYGIQGDRGTSWGYHFGNAFKYENKHFQALQKQGVVFFKPECPQLQDRFDWLANCGQWGIPGWSMSKECLEIIIGYAKGYENKNVLEIGSSRGRLSAILSSLGCRLTTIDHHDRGACQNLEGLDVKVVTDRALTFFSKTNDKFDCIVIDLHGNSETDWRELAPFLQRSLARSGLMLINNAALWKIPEWGYETGVQWFLENLPKTWSFHLHEKPVPGIAVVRGSP